MTGREAAVEYADLGIATPLEWKEIWKHFNRMQKRVMAEPLTTKQEFFAEHEVDRMEFYRWMEQQCGEMACWI